MMNFKLPALTALLLLIACYQCGSQLKGVQVAEQLKSTEPAPELRAAARDRFTAADFEQHVARLKKQLPKDKFTIVVQPPFVVIGDEKPELVRQHAVNTVKWTVDLLKKDYFAKDPSEILDIWLFRDTASYRQNARAIFNDEPDTPYGYYSSAHRALIMNIETGGGTLVHEIVHPFIEANFPACPAWFNEGLASLYEQSGEVDGQLHGFPNWRLPGLKQAIKDGAVPSFKSLMEMNAEAFYHQDKGTNYSQSRYLCYYLQEKGLLVKFYREFTANQSADPTGYLSLQKVLGESDLRAFQKKWEQFVLGLSQGYNLDVVSE
jgi:hypothetical protein